MRDSRLPIDDLDRRILRSLRDTPRATFTELADTVGVSRTAFKARLDRLWDTGVIVGRETQLDLASMGFSVQAWIALEVQQGELVAVSERLADMPQVIEAFATTGDADVQCRVAARDTLDLQAILLSIASLPVITRTSSSVILSSLVNHHKVQVLDLLDL